jgi:hypothetical protein
VQGDDRSGNSDVRRSNASINLLQAMMIVLLTGKKQMTGISACGSDGKSSKGIVTVRYHVAIVNHNPKYSLCVRSYFHCYSAV